MDCDRNIAEIMWLANMKKANPKRYKEYLESLKEVMKDVTKITMELAKELADEIEKGEEEK